MRISKEQTQQNRDQILKTAAKLFRERGFDGIGVADIMKKAGFTVGGFYNHFASKDDLAAEATTLAFANSTARTAKLETPEQILKRYLSEEHRDAPGTGCPVAALGSEGPHQAKIVEEAFSRGIENWIERLEAALQRDGHTKPKARRELAVNLLARAVGGLVLARASSRDKKLSDEILSTALRATLAEAKLG